MSNRKELIAIYKDTQKGVTGCGSYKQSVKYREEDLPTYDEIIGNSDLVRHRSPAKVKVVNEDTLDTAMIMCEDHELEPLILNMASETHPGGGVAKGNHAQEECLFRRTNYCNCVNKRDHYPIGPDEFVVTEEVTIVKNSDHAWLSEDDQFVFNFIAMPAVRQPILKYIDEPDPVNTGNNRAVYKNLEELETMRQKIDLIFRYAVLEEYDSLLLGALGCGAFRNPPTEVVQLFQEAIEKYGIYFKEIWFAVLAEDRCLNYDYFKVLER